MRRVFTVASVLSLPLCVSVVCCAVEEHHYHSYAELLDIPLPAAREALFVWDGPTNSLEVLWTPATPGQFGPSTGVIVRGWLILGGLALAPTLRFALLIRDRSCRRRLRAGHCEVCLYDLTGNTSGVCPECGTPVTKKPGTLTV